MSADRAELAAAAAAAAFSCAGTPRDLGRQQGIACGAELQQAFLAEPWLARLRARLRQRGAESRLRRDFWRHFPHQAERLQALARAARVPEAWLLRELASELREGSAPDALALVPCGEAPLLVGWFGAPLRLRESRPDGRYASLEWCASCASAARLGVNERGLAVAALSLVGAGQLPSSHPRAETAPEGPRCAVPATLLVQDCLENFDRLEPAVEWCLARPAGGMARILIADAQGYAASIDFALGERSLHWFEGEPLVAVRRPEHGEAIAKLLLARDATAADPAAVSELWLTRLLRGGSGGSSGAVDPLGRRAGWLEPGAPSSKAPLFWRALTPTPESGDIR